ncbi:rod shape-determining protein MreC [Anaerosalibacter bizertensis]|uniref:Cell shape-determining protein MreC n=1 Tax=Anaerosalibacter bizertensis TaxID=932217 RepID=A0A844FHY4_9FIRM|nr:rod shape-determining protein MreC [Anaerosalibacter bizertensis]MBV1817679.1 rod shape-determining protein MreC [Bacteroidales bacterium MSK.15.36]HHV27488.1 rod shape-determining protein MreC [Tissierellia bacterium]MBU5294065.1 rod shape-determining protein MreC [Anaerosalibacter bizertensis]MCB5558653.1 rod shape-determining protein MreC [Anaerosalibacter bizertensis]MCG4585077.1 rod shape-determining protein MreC [Anaerosalibacter bizertensis]
MSKFKKYKDRMIVTTVAIILIVIIGMTSSERIKITGFEKAIGNIISPVEKLFFNVGKSVSNIFGTIGNIGKFKEENEQLKKKIALLEEENRKYEDIIGKTDFLRNEARLKEKTSYKLIDAQVVGKEPGNWFDRFIIDKGLNDGIKKGDTVIQGVEVNKSLIQEGVVGRITDVGDNWAKVSSIVDESSNISFRVTRTQDGGILSGSVDNKLSGYFFDNKADVKKGDKLFTSGLGESYVKDLYIGEVKEVVKKEEDLMKRVVVAPAVNFKKIYRVHVISN